LTDWWTLESGKFKRGLPIFKRGDEIVLNIVQIIFDKYFEIHPPESVTFRFPITYDMNISYRGAGLLYVTVTSLYNTSVDTGYFRSLNTTLISEHT